MELDGKLHPFFLKMIENFMLSMKCVGFLVFLRWETDVFRRQYTVSYDTGICYRGAVLGSIHLPWIGSDWNINQVRVDLHCWIAMIVDT